MVSQNYCSNACESFHTISENCMFLVSLKQTASGNLEPMCDYHLDTLIAKHRLKKFKNIYGNI